MKLLHSQKRKERNEYVWNKEKEKEIRSNAYANTQQTNTKQKQLTDKIVK